LTRIHRQRYQQIGDNLVSAFHFYFKQFEDKIKELSTATFTQHIMSQKDELATMKRLAKLYVDDDLSYDIQFGVVRDTAFSILSKEELLSKVTKLTDTLTDLYG
jgi:hypothetical protein